MRPLENQVAGTLAQLVEHRTENPGVPGSIPGGTTKKQDPLRGPAFFVISCWLLVHVTLIKLTAMENYQLPVAVEKALLPKQGLGG